MKVSVWITVSQPWDKKCWCGVYKPLPILETLLGNVCVYTSVFICVEKANYSGSKHFFMHDFSHVTAGGGQAANENEQVEKSRELNVGRMGRFLEMQLGGGGLETHTGDLSDFMRSFVCITYSITFWRWVESHAIKHRQIAEISNLSFFCSFLYNRDNQTILASSCHTFHLLLDLLIQINGWSSQR